MSVRFSGAQLLAIIAALLLAFGARAGTAPQTITFAQPAAKTYGAAPFTVSATASSALPVTITSLTAGVCKIAAGSVTLVAAGTCTLRASQAGNATYAAAANIDRSFAVAKAAQTITFTLAASATYGNAPIAATATASSGLAVALASKTTALCTVGSGKVTIVGAGNCVIEATQAGNANYNAAPPVDRTLKVAKAAQTITFATLAARTYGAKPFTIAASASSKLPVTFASTTAGTCSVAANTVTLLAAGTCSIRASQAGNDNYNAAPNVTQSLSIAKAAQTIAFAAPASHMFGGAPFSLVATSSSGLPVAFASTTTSVCKVAGTTLTIAAAGTCSVKASQAGNASYLAASDVTRSFSIAKSAQTIAFAPISAHGFGDAPFALTATSSAGLTVTLASTTGTVCNVSAATLTITAAGNCSTRASQAGNANVLAAADVVQAFAVAQAAQTISFAAIPAHAFGDAPFTVTVTASSSLPVALASLTMAVCSVADTTVTLQGNGTCTLRATQAGSANYLAAASVDRSFAVGLGAQAIAFDAPSAKTFGDPPFAVAASSSSGLPVVLASTTPGVCSVGGLTVTIVAAGTCALHATQAGNANYAPATPVDRNFAIAKASQTIAFAALPPRATNDAPFAVAATASSQLAVHFTSATTSVCTVSAGTVTLVHAGTCRIDANQPGDTNFTPAATVSQTFAVNAATQSIDFGPIADQTLAASPITVHASASSALPVTLASLTPAVCSASAASVAFLAPGTCTLHATQPGNATYPAATPVDRSFAVLRAPQVITFPALASHMLGDVIAVAAASASSGLPVGYASLTPAVCTTDGGASIQLLAAGRCNVRAAQPGNAQYAAAASVDQGFDVSSGSTRVKLTAVGPQTTASASVALSATAPAGESIVYAAAPSTVCTIAGASVTMLAPGACTVSAFESTDGIHGQGTPATTTFPVLRAPAFHASATLATPAWPFSITAGHLRHADIVDLVVVGNGTIAVLDGDGHGGFARHDFASPFANAYASVTADFDGDGALDFGFASVSDNALGVYLGDGSGDLVNVSGWPPALATPAPSDLVVADLDGDGKLDLAATNIDQDVPRQSFDVFYGNGDGTFHHGGPVPVCGDPLALAVADFNEDGKPDVVAGCARDNAVQLVTFHDGGAFSPLQPIGGVYAPYRIAAADIDGDGHIDLVVSSSYQILITLRGHGDGSFDAPVVAATGAGTGDLAIGDFNGDGTLDIAISASVDDAILLIAGAGDGHFAPPLRIPTGRYPESLIAADFDGDGRIDLAFVSSQDDDAVILHNDLVAPAAAHAVAMPPRDQSAAPRTRFPRPLAVQVSDAGGAPVVGAQVRFTLSSIAGGPLFTNGAREAEDYTDRAGVASSPGVVAGSAAGTFAADARIAGLSVDFTLSILAGGTPPTFASTNPPPGTPGVAYTFDLVASGAPAPGFAIASGALPPGLTLATNGHITGTPTASGDFNGAFRAYNGVPPDAVEAFTIHIGGQAQTITFNTIADQPINASSVAAVAAASSGLSVSFASLTPQTCWTSGATVRFMAAGSCTIRATQPGNAQFVAAMPVEWSFTIQRGPQGVSLKLYGDTRIGIPPTRVDVVTTSGLAAAVASTTPATCAIVDTTYVRFLARGACTLQASQPGNASYAPAQASITVNVQGALQQVDFPMPHLGHIDEISYLLATASSGLPITYQSTTSETCAIYFGNAVGHGSSEHPSSAFCTIVARQPGNDVYESAQASQTFIYGVNFDPITDAPPPVPHIVYAMYLGGLGIDQASGIAVAPDGGAWVTGVVGSSNFSGLSSQRYSNAGLGAAFVSKLEAQSGRVDVSAAVGGPPPGIGVTAFEIAEGLATAVDPRGAMLVVARATSVDFPQHPTGSYARSGPLAIFRVDIAGQVQRVVSALDPAIVSVRALASDAQGAIYLAGIANQGLATTTGAAIATSALAAMPFAAKYAAGGSLAFATYLTVHGSRAGAGTPDLGGGTSDASTVPRAIAVDGAANVFVAGQATAGDIPATPGALDTNDHNNRDGFIVKLDPTGSRILASARLGFKDVDRVTAVAVAPDGAIVVAGKTASADFVGRAAFQTGVTFSQNGWTTYQVDREIGFVGKLDPALAQIQFMAAIGTSGGDLLNGAASPLVSPLAIAVDATGAIYATGTTLRDRTLPLLATMPGVDDGNVFLMKITPVGGLAYSTLIGSGTATGVASDGFGNAYVVGNASGDMPTLRADQAACTIGPQGGCGTPFVVKVNDAPLPVRLGSTQTSVDQGSVVTLSATIGDRRAGGTIDFTEDGAILATVPVSQGSAAYALTPTPGFHRYVATFRGDNYANGTSSPEFLLEMRQWAAN